MYHDRWCCSMIGPEGDVGVIPRFCRDLISQGNSDARVRLTRVMCLIAHTRSDVCVQFKIDKLA